MTPLIQADEDNGIRGTPDVPERNSLSRPGELPYHRTLPAVDPAGTGEFGLIYQIDWYLCDGCGLCGEVCPPDIIVIEGFKAIIPLKKYADCYECGSCMSVCMKDAIFRV